MMMMMIIPRLGCSLMTFMTEFVAIMAHAQHNDDNSNAELQVLCGRILAAFELQVMDDEAMFAGKSADEARRWIAVNSSSTTTTTSATTTMTKTTTTTTTTTVDQFPAGWEAQQGGEGGRGGGRDLHLGEKGVFLLVDEEVLDSVAKAKSVKKKPWFKVVEVDYDPAKHGPSPRMGPRRYLAGCIAWRIVSGIYGMRWTLSL